MQVLESDSLKFVQDLENNNDDCSIFWLHLEDKPIMRVNIQIQDQLQSIFVSISEIDAKNKSNKLFII